MRHLILSIFLVGIYAAKAQFFKGVGIFGAVNTSAHFYKNLDTYRKLDTPYVLNRFYVPSHISKELINWGAGIFAEFSTRDKLRWQTEVMYTHKGAKEMELVAPYTTGNRTGTYVTNKYTYIQWNNYLKFYNPAGFGSHWYVMPGIRLEYLFRKSTPVFSQVSSNFPTFWFSGDLGAGYEFPFLRGINAFTEFHWNPDLIRRRQDNVRVWARTYELRVGLVLRKKRKGVDDCTAPRYNGPAY